MPRACPLVYILAIDMESPCYLCRFQLESVKGKGRHKKVKGRFCDSERAAWKGFTTECGCFSVDEQAIDTDHAILCYSCIAKVNKLDKLRKQLYQLKTETAGILGCNTDDGDSSQVMETASEQPHTSQRRTKRPKAQTGTSKRPRTSVSY